MLSHSKNQHNSKTDLLKEWIRSKMYVLLIIYENWVPREKRNTWVLWKITMGAWTLCMSWKMTAWASSWVENNIHQFEISLKSQESVFLLLMDLLVLLHMQALVLPNVCCPNFVLRIILLFSLFCNFLIYCVLGKCLWIELIATAWI